MSCLLCARKLVSNISGKWIAGSSTPCVVWVWEVLRNNASFISMGSEQFSVGHNTVIILIAAPSCFYTLNTLARILWKHLWKWQQSAVCQHTEQSTVKWDNQTCTEEPYEKSQSPAIVCPLLWIEKPVVEHSHMPAYQTYPRYLYPLLPHLEGRSHTRYCAKKLELLNNSRNHARY